MRSKLSPPAAAFVPVLPVEVAEPISGVRLFLFLGINRKGGEHNPALNASRGKAMLYHFQARERIRRAGGISAIGHILQTNG
jgi:hypothetical protein